MTVEKLPRYAYGFCGLEVTVDVRPCLMTAVSDVLLRSQLDRQPYDYERLTSLANQIWRDLPLQDFKEPLRIIKSVTGRQLMFFTPAGWWTSHGGEGSNGLLLTATSVWIGHPSWNDFDTKRWDNKSDYSLCYCYYPVDVDCRSDALWANYTWIRDFEISSSIDWERYSPFPRTIRVPLGFYD